MTIEWGAFFLSELVQNPILLVVTLLNIGVIIVNGATDAPNAIATAVSTRAMKPRHADYHGGGVQFPGAFARVAGLHGGSPAPFPPWWTSAATPIRP